MFLSLPTLQSSASDMHSETGAHLSGIQKSGGMLTGSVGNTSAANSLQQQEDETLDEQGSEVPPQRNGSIATGDEGTEDSEATHEEQVQLFQEMSNKLLNETSAKRGSEQRKAAAEQQRMEKRLAIVEELLATKKRNMVITFVFLTVVLLSLFLSLIAYNVGQKKHWEKSLLK